MSKNGSWHDARNNPPIARVHTTGIIEHPGPMRGRFHRTPLPADRGTVNSAGAIAGFQGVGPAAYYFQHHRAEYPSERRHQTCCHHSHYRAADLRMRTWRSSTILSYLYQSERRSRY